MDLARRIKYLRAYDLTIVGVTLGALRPDILNIEEILQEYRRYLELCLVESERLPLGSQLVAKAWNTHRSTSTYHDMCERVFGCRLHSRPVTHPSDPAWRDYVSVTLARYRERFGEPNPTIWPGAT